MNATPVKTPGQGSLQIINIEGRYHKCEQFYNDLTTALIPQRHFSGTTLRQRSPLHRHRSALTCFGITPAKINPMMITDQIGKQPAAVTNITDIVIL